MSNIMIEKAFERAFLSEDTGFCERAVSRAICVAHAKVVLNVVVHFLGAESIINFLVEGSYDGQVWVTTNLSSLALTSLTTAPDSQHTSSVAVDYGYLRVRAYVSGEIPSLALFSANLVFAHP